MTDVIKDIILNGQTNTGIRQDVEEPVAEPIKREVTDIRD